MEINHVIVLLMIFFIRRKAFAKQNNKKLQLNLKQNCWSPYISATEFLSNNVIWDFLFLTKILFCFFLLKSYQHSHVKPQRNDEFLQWRRHGIGACGDAKCQNLNSFLKKRGEYLENEKFLLNPPDMKFYFFLNWKYS